MFDENYFFPIKQPPPQKKIECLKFVIYIYSCYFPENTTPSAVPHVDLPMCRTRLGAVNNQYKNNQYTQAILQG